MRHHKLTLALAILCSVGACAAWGTQLKSVDIAGMDTSIKPGNDFYGYSNGHWQQATQIPADRSSVTIFYEIEKKAEQRTAELIKDAA